MLMLSNFTSEYNQLYFQELHIKFPLTQDELNISVHIG